MAFGKSAEEKAAEKAAEQAAREREAAAAAVRAADVQRAKARAAFLASPIGQATTAKEQRQGFFEVQLTVGSSQRTTSMLAPTGGETTGVIRTVNHAGTLAGIEAVGWRLEHVGYVFVVTGESSRERAFGTGENTAVTGQTIGIYLFRNSDTA